MSEAKLLSKEDVARLREEMKKSLSWEEVAALWGHIAALEADNAAFQEFVLPHAEVTCEEAPAARECGECVPCRARVLTNTPHPGAALLEHMRRLEAFAEAFATVAENAQANHERPKGGQHVPYQDDFAHGTPSMFASLRRWARAAREALAP